MPAVAELATVRVRIVATNALEAKVSDKVLRLIFAFKAPLMGALAAAQAAFAGHGYRLS